MLSPLDLVVAFAAALLLFGPEQLPQVARKAGRITRDLQNTSQAFIREMERAADFNELLRARPPSRTPETTYPAEITIPPPGVQTDPWPSAEPAVTDSGGGRFTARPPARPLV